MTTDAIPDPLEETFRTMLAETMNPCRELPLGERLAKREQDAVQQALLCPQPVDDVVGDRDKAAS